MPNLFVGDVGIDIRLDCGIDISTATVRKIVARSPKGVKKTWSATLRGTTELSYITQDGDINESGVWKLQAYVEMPLMKCYGTVVTLPVENPL